MEITVITDLHLEFDHIPTLGLTGGNILLLPGDIVVAALLRKNRTDKNAKKAMRVADAFFKEECAKYVKVYYIMGNHEHYHNVFDCTADDLREYLEGTNVTLLEKEFVDLDNGWQLFGATLWTDYDNLDWFARQAAQNNINDHTIIKKIRNDTMCHFMPHDAYEEHKKTLEIFQRDIYDWKRIDRKTIVMTHHAPTAMSVHPRFTGDINNYAYYTDLSELILDNPNIKYWVHGHMHDMHDYMVGDCRVVCNPRGYAGYEVNPHFDRGFTITVD